MGVSTAASVRGSIQERPKAVVFMVALCSRTRSLKDVNFTRHRRVFAKTFLPVGFLAAPHVSRRYQLLPSSSSGVLSANELRYLRHWRSRGGHRPAGFQMAIRNAP